jgi:hypothetical protein
MAVTLATLGTSKRITLSATPNVVTEVSMPEFANVLEIQFIANDGKVTESGTDNAAIGSDFTTLQSDTLYRVELLPKAGVTTAQKRYLASSTGSTVVEVRALRSSLLGAGVSTGGGGGGGGGVANLQDAYDGGATISTAGSTALAITLASGDLTVAGGGAADFGFSGTDLSSFKVGAGTLDLQATSTVDIDSSGGEIRIGNDANAQNIKIGTGAAARDITVGNLTGATTIFIRAASGVNIDSNGSIGVGNADGSTAIDIGTSGSATRAVSVGSTVSASTLTLSAGTGALAVSGGGDVTLSDGYRAGSTYSAAIKLAGASSEWSDLETNNGSEVSLIKAINNAHTSSTIEQVVYAETTTATTPSPLTTYTALTNVTASITPKKNTNKVLVTICIPYQTTRSSIGTGIGIRIKRGSTVIWEMTDDASGPLYYASFTGATASQLGGTCVVVVQDSPATTSSTTYTVEGRVRSSLNSGTATFMPAGSTVTAPGSILLQEVRV